MRDFCPESIRINEIFKLLTKEQRQRAVMIVGIMFPEVRAELFKRKEA